MKGNSRNWSWAGLDLLQSPAQMEAGFGGNQIIDEESSQDAPDYRFVVKNFSNENDIIQELEKPAWL